MTKLASLNSGPLRGWFAIAIAWVIAFDVAFIWQRVSGAHSSEFGGHSEESAHYLGGLMVRDYMAARFPGKLTEFAENYRAHYPSVAAAGTPSAFHLAEGVWMLPFGVSRLSAMLLMCAIAATLASLLFQAVKEEFGPALAITAIVILLSLPFVREYYSMLMPETLTAALMFAATMVFGRYMDEERGRYAICFGVLTGLAIVSKITGFALVAFVPLAIAFARKWQLLARPSLWGGLGIAAVIGGPWTWHFRDHDLSSGASLDAKALPFYLGELGFALGIVLSLFLCLGLILRLIQPAARVGRWAALGALIVAVLLFNCLAVAGPREGRHVLPIVPAALMFIVASAVTIQEWLGRRWKQAGSSQSAIAVVLLCFAFAITEATSRVLNLTPRKQWVGFGKIAEEIMDEDPFGRLRIMVSSDLVGEGMFTSELAMREKRPGHRIRSAGKELARTDGRGRAMRPRFRTEDELSDWFAKAGVDYILIDETIPDQDRGEYHDQLIRTVDAHTERFSAMTKSTIARAGQGIPGAITLYRVKNVE